MVRISGQGNLAAHRRVPGIPRPIAGLTVGARQSTATQDSSWPSPVWSWALWRSYSFRQAFYLACRRVRGHRAHSQIAQSGGELGGTGLATAGLV